MASYRPKVDGTAPMRPMGVDLAHFLALVAPVLLIAALSLVTITLGWHALAASISGLVFSFIVSVAYALARRRSRQVERDWPGV